MDSSQSTTGNEASLPSVFHSLVHDRELDSIHRLSNLSKNRCIYHSRQFIQHFAN